MSDLSSYQANMGNIFFSYSTIIVTTLTLLVLKIAMSALNVQFNFTYIKKKSLLPPGPTQWPILGNAFRLLKKEPTFLWLHKILAEYNTEIACVCFGSVHVIPVSCPQIALEFLKEQDALFASRPITMATDVLSWGHKNTVFSPNGDQWRKMRRAVSSEIVSPARHIWLHDKRIEEVDNLVKYVHNLATKTGLVNIRTASRHFSGNLIRKMVFNRRYFGEGKQDGGPGFEEEEHVGAIFTAVQNIYSFCASDYFPFLVGLDLFGHEKIIKQVFKTVSMYHDPIIDERIKKWRKFNPITKNVEIEKTIEPQDLLDVLVSLSDTNGFPLLTVDEVKAETNELMMAAMDNPSNAVEWAMAEMINKPELLQKAIEELDIVVGKNRLVQESDIPHLNFVKSCAREAFRLHPVAPFNLPHVAMSDTTVAGCFIPKGSHVLLSRIGLGRNPKVWDDPLEFKPERHLSETSNVVLTEPDLRFVSFSTGRRGCVASTLGTTMTIMLLASLLHGFEWRPPPNVSRIDLAESKDSLFMANALLAQAEPRLPRHLYPSN